MVANRETILLATFFMRGTSPNNSRSLKLNSTKNLPEPMSRTALAAVECRKTVASAVRLIGSN